MLRVIHKFEYRNEMKLPKNYKVVHIGVQDGVIMLWADVPFGEEEMVKTRFILLPTGIFYDESSLGRLDHVQTIFKDKFVWHICEKTL